MPKPSASSGPVAMIAEALQAKLPLVLFAGQSLDRSHAPILAALLDRIDCEDRSSGWKTALKQGLTDDDLSWLSERFDRSVRSAASAPIFDFAWSAVFTSSIDPQFPRRFETRGRLPEAVLSKHGRARVPRSRSRPPVYHLLGKSDETVAEARAPRTQMELKSRAVIHTADLVGRIAETATVRGLVVIAGYCPAGDLMPADDLLAPLLIRPGPTVIWFDAPDQLDSDIAEQMIRDGALITADGTLTEAIGQLELRGEIDLAESAAPDEPGMVTLSGGTVLDLQPALRLRVEASAAIVDDEWTEAPDPLNEDESAESFRRFHGTFGDFRVLVSGVPRGYCIEREFEQRLWNTVLRKLDSLGRHESDDVIVLHGQSGTGKTIALARLARRLRVECRLPVVVANHRIPTDTDIEAFCLQAERLDAKATVLICDCNQPPHRYGEISSALRSRGRRLLIVGTCYRLETVSPDRFVEAPTLVSPSEMSAFEDFRKRFCPDLPQSNSTDSSNSTNSIFAMLYRSLPFSRGTLATGIASEARAAEGKIREQARSMPQYTIGISPLAQQLIDLDLVPDSRPLFEDDAARATLGLDSAGRLVEYVMVAGRVYCHVPMNLMLRVLSDDDSLDADQIKYLFSDLDLIRTTQDYEGADYYLAPRLQLEADLICRRRLTPETEIDRLIDLIRSARPGVDERIERDFLLRLLYNIDRSGPRKKAYSEGYLRFADALKLLREQHATVDPDLVLRECVLRRRAVQSQRDFRSDVPVHESLATLNDARDAIDRALREIDDDGVRISSRTKQSLVTERAAIYGFLAVQQARQDTQGAFWSDYLAARTASNCVIGVSGGSLHPVNIALWTGRDVLREKRDELTPPQAAELRADLYANIDFADDLVGVTRRPIRRSHTSHVLGDVDEHPALPEELSEYLPLRSQVADAMGDTDLDEQTLRMLSEIAPQTAIFLIARRRAESVYAGRCPFDRDTRALAADTADYIDSQTDIGVNLDDRCRRLLLTLRWAHVTGERLMFRQRGKTPPGEQSISRLFRTVSALNESGGADARIRERYLEAVLSWLLRDTKHASSLWQSLSDDTDYQDRHRTVRWHLVSDEQGEPRRFRGRVEVSDVKHTVRVEEMEQSIALSLHDFPSDEIRHGRELRDFGIAFNYIGPIADPLSRHSPRRR